MKKIIKTLTYGLLCATTIGCLASCKSNEEYEYKIYCYVRCQNSGSYSSTCGDSSVTEQSSEMDLIGAVEVTAVHVGDMYYAYGDRYDHIHYIVKYKK